MLDRLRLRKLSAQKPVLWIATVYGLVVFMLIGASVLGIKRFPREFPAHGFSLESVGGTEGASYDPSKGTPAIVYFFASW